MIKKTIIRVIKINSMITDKKSDTLIENIFAVQTNDSIHYFDPEDRTGVRTIPIARVKSLNFEESNDITPFLTQLDDFYPVSDLAYEVFDNVYESFLIKGNRIKTPDMYESINGVILTPVFAIGDEKYYLVTLNNKSISGLLYVFIHKGISISSENVKTLDPNSKLRAYIDYTKAELMSLNKSTKLFSA
jgi:hypothetical protein